MEDPQPVDNSPSRNIIQHAKMRHAFPAYFNKQHGRSFNEDTGSLSSVRNLVTYKPLKPNALDEYDNEKAEQRKSIRKNSGVKWVKVQPS